MKARDRCKAILWDSNAVYTNIGKIFCTLSNNGKRTWILLYRVMMSQIDAQSNQNSQITIDAFGLEPMTPDHNPRRSYGIDQKTKKIMLKVSIKK